MGVYLSYVTARGHAFLDCELYLLEDWCDDPLRRSAAHIPEPVTFQTKPELALRMLKRAQAAGVPSNWTVADTVYGHGSTLRTWLEQQGRPYALAVPSTESVCVWTQQGCLLNDVASIGATVLGKQDWQRLSQSLGTKGERLFDWAILPLWLHGSVDKRHFLVFRRCLDDPTKITYYLVFTPFPTPLYVIVQAIGARWHVEEDLEVCKDLGMGQYEVRSYLGWYRHMVLVMLAYAFLVQTVLQEQQEHPTAQQSAPCEPMIALTCSEARHLLARLIWPTPCSVSLVCQWSKFRRMHQYWAGYYHRRRRQKMLCG